MKPSVVRVRQDRETSLQRFSGLFSCRFAYARAAESRIPEENGQDYLAFAVCGPSFRFVLCDGVGLSFCGDLAARFLGDSLLGWLSSPGMDRPSGQTALQKELDDYLRMLTGPASDAVRSHPLPPGVSGLVRDVLEEKRKCGSETTFVCGRVDLPGETFKQGRLVLAWMGDSRLRLWSGSEEKSSVLGDAFRTSERWSTLRGPVGGDPHVVCGTLQGIDRLLAYTDGIGELDGCASVPDDRELQSLIEAAGSKASSDDMALLDLAWSTDQVPSA